MLKSLARETSKATAGVTTEVVTITPSMAEAWLEKNNHNRKAAANLVARYARDMQEGRWRFVGDAIRFDADGVVLDGQHRLMAVVKSGVPLVSVVIYGLPSEARDVIDTGKARNASDILELSHITNSTRVGSVARLYAMYRDDKIALNLRYSPAEILAIAKANPGMSRSSGIVPKLIRNMPAATIVFLHFVAEQKLRRPEKAAALYDVLRTGKASYDGCPIFEMREKHIKTLGDKRRTPHTVAAWTWFYAWNAFVRDEPVKVIQWRKTPTDIEGLKRSTL